MPARIRHRIIIDTNLWISFLLTSDYSKIDALLAADDITLLLSQELIEEFVAVAQRPKFKKYFSLSDIEDLLTTAKTKAQFIAVNSIFSICRDPKDNFLLSLAKDTFRSDSTNAQQQLCKSWATKPTHHIARSH